MSQLTETQGLRSLNDDGELQVAEDNADVRGWNVETNDGEVVGEVDDLLVDPTRMKVRYLTVELDSDSLQLKERRVILVPIEQAQINQQKKSVLLTGTGRTQVLGLPPYSQASGASTASSASNAVSASPLAAAPRSGQEARLTRAEEELRVGKRSVEAGEVVVGKHVETEHVSQPVTRMREQVRIERRPIDPTASASSIDITDQEIRVPLMQEEVVVEKRVVAREELVISKEMIEEAQTVEADLRREEFDIKPTDLQPGSDVSGATVKGRGER